MDKSPPSLRRLFLLTLLLFSSTAYPVYGQAGEDGDDPGGLPALRLAEAVRVDVGPVVDGNLDDPVWAEAPPLSGFVQHEPQVGSPVTEGTEVRIVYDDDALYVGAWLFDRAPQEIVVGERRRNANLRQSDAFIIVLDTYQDRQNGFVFGTNPGGIEYDGQVRGGGGVNTNWDGSWSVATSRDTEGWYVEMRIPFSTLRYGSREDQTWGVNAARYIGRKNEQAFWSPVPRQFDLYRLTEAGLLQGISPPPQRVTTVTPYALGAAQRIPTLEPGTTYPVDFGADAKLGITPSLSLDLTVNTDFAQVEADDQQVDLTRFNLFFPEKRPFFLENSDLFSVVSSRPGAAPTPAQLFHSRRIGVHQGQEVPIEWGARLSGRVGSTDVGLVHMSTEGREGVQDPNRWSVLRLAQELPNRSRVGGMVTLRSSSLDSDDYNRLYSADARLGIGDRWTFDAVASRTDTPGVEEGEEMYLIAGEYRTTDWQLSGHYDRIGQNFRPDVGFVRRVGYSEKYARAMRFIRLPQVEWLRELRPHVRYALSHDPSGFKETEIVHMHTHVEFESGHLTMPAVDWVLDGLSEPFRIAGTDIVVPPGTYSGWTTWNSFRTNPAATISFNTRGEIGSFLSGRRAGISGGVNLRLGGTLSGETSVNHNRIQLDEGTFNTTLTRFRLRYAFTPALSLESLVQYSDQTGVWSGNVRLAWLDTAGTGLFIVYNERQFLDDVVGIRGILPGDALEPSERSVVIKFTRQFDVSRMADGFLN